VKHDIITTTTTTNTIQRVLRLSICRPHQSSMQLLMQSMHTGLLILLRLLPVLPTRLLPTL